MKKTGGQLSPNSLLSGVKTDDLYVLKTGDFTSHNVGLQATRTSTLY